MSKNLKDIINEVLTEAPMQPGVSTQMPAQAQAQAGINPSKERVGTAQQPQHATAEQKTLSDWELIYDPKEKIVRVYNSNNKGFKFKTMEEFEGWLMKTFPRGLHIPNVQKGNALERTTDFKLISAWLMKYKAQNKPQIKDIDISTSSVTPDEIEN